jgi:predicted RNA-binding protein with PIN domain
LPDGTPVREKIEEIRVFSAEKSKPVKEAAAGALVALYGTDRLSAGMGLGVESGAENILTPVLDYCMLLPDGINPVDAFARIRTLAEEDPALDLHYDSEAGRIRVRLMGEIQLEVLKTLIEERFSLAVGFDEGTVLYRETVAAPVMGYGHFEPLRHYAEVHLLIEPLPVGSGIVCAADCSTDDLALSWQRLILTHIEERAHRGALLGAPLTDVRITLIRGKAHLKHTQGGDFRQATYRAVRHGVRCGEGVILEPTFDFTMELPDAAVGRALTDIAQMGGTVASHTSDGGVTVLIGNAPVVCLRSYPTTLRAYTKGEGKISLAVGPYAPCHNPDEVIAARGYDPDLDERHTADSVFCKQGSGYAVPWYEAKDMMHLPTGYGSEEAEEEAAVAFVPKKQENVTEKEWVEIFERTYGKIKPRTVSEKRVNAAPTEEKRKPKKPQPPKQEYLVLDGYNVIFAMPALRRLAEADIGDARDALIRTVCNLAAMKKCRALIVFDAYRRKEGVGSEEEIGPVTVVYTKEKQTADAFIENTTYHIAEHYRVRVVSSDKDEQFVILGHGALRVSVREFEAELKSAAVVLEDYLYGKK